MDEFCAHRGTSLWVGRNEEDGLRCPYHGWKYDHTGQCIEVPSEPVESGFCAKIKLKSYPLVKRGDVLWTYMGPPEKQPPLPEFEFATVPAGADLHFEAAAGMQLAAGARRRHRFQPQRLAAQRRVRQSIRSTSAPRATTTRSAMCGRISRWWRARPASTSARAATPRAGKYYWRITQWIMPCMTMIPPRGDHPTGGHFWVPIDDENCWIWNWDYHAMRPLTEAEVTAMKNGYSRHVIYEVDTRPAHLARAGQQGQRLPDRPRGAEGRPHL